MGSNCCRTKDQSPKVSLTRILSRWSHRLSPKSEIVKISGAEEDGYVSSKKKESISDPVFESSPNEDRNHVTMLLPDAPRVPPRKKPRLNNKRVSFQSDVEIMRTASSKSLDRFTVTVIQEEPKARSKSVDSFFDKLALIPAMGYLKERRTSSLEYLTFEEIQTAPSLVNKLRRDTLGDAMDLQSYKRPLVLPKPEEPLIEEESGSSCSEEEITSFKLAAKLRRDTLGDALKISSTSRRQADTPIDSSNEDLEETVKHSMLCSKLRRDTFGDALRQAVHCKACSSLEDMTELEVPLPATPEEDEEEFEGNETLSGELGDNNANENSQNDMKQSNIIWGRVDSETRCKTCLRLEVTSDDTDQCSACSSAENITCSTNRTVDEFNNLSPEIKLSDKKTQPVQIITTTSIKQLMLTDSDIVTTLEKIRTTGKVEPNEPYNLVYSSHMKGPFASSRESITKDEKVTSSDDDFLKTKPSLVKDDTLPSAQNMNHLVT